MGVVRTTDQEGADPMRGIGAVHGVRFLPSLGKWVISSEPGASDTGWFAVFSDRRVDERDKP